MCDCRKDFLFDGADPDAAEDPNGTHEVPFWMVFSRGMRDSFSTFYGFLHHCFCKTLFVSEHRFHCAVNHVFTPLKDPSERPLDKDFYFMIICPPPLGGYRLSRPWSQDLQTFRSLVYNVNKVTPEPKFVAVVMDMFSTKGRGAKYETQVRDVQSVLSELRPEFPIVCIPASSPVKRAVLPEHLEMFRFYFGDGYYSFWVMDIAFVVVDTAVWCQVDLTDEQFQAQVTWLESTLLQLSQDDRCKFIVILQHRAWFVETVDEPTDWNNIPLPRHRARMVTELFQKMEKVRAVLCIDRLRRDVYTQAIPLIANPTPLQLPQAKLTVFIESLDNVSFTEDELRSGGRIQIVVRVVLGDIAVATKRRPVAKRLQWVNIFFEFPDILATSLVHLPLHVEVYKTKLSLYAPKPPGKKGFTPTVESIAATKKKGKTSTFTERILPPPAPGAPIPPPERKPVRPNPFPDMDLVATCEISVDQLEPGITVHALDLTPSFSKEERASQETLLRHKSMIGGRRVPVDVPKKVYGKLTLRTLCEGFGHIVPTEMVLFPDVAGIAVGRVHAYRLDWQFFEQSTEVPFLNLINFSTKVKPPPNLDAEEEDDISVLLRQLDSTESTMSQSVDEGESEDEEDTTTAEAFTFDSSEVEPMELETLPELSHLGSGGFPNPPTQPEQEVEPDETAPVTFLVTAPTMVTPRTAALTAAEFNLSLGHIPQISSPFAVAPLATAPAKVTRRKVTQQVSWQASEDITTGGSSSSGSSSSSHSEMVAGPPRSSARASVRFDQQPPTVTQYEVLTPRSDNSPRPPNASNPTTEANTKETNPEGGTP